ncbi:MAG: acetoacetate decarboxylase family protein [Pseudomonadota bacterium]|nr:acetoacetate decarboxylase family protein [Pseudomonadota bacterium]
MFNSLNLTSFASSPFLPAIWPRRAAPVQSSPAESYRAVGSLVLQAAGAPLPHVEVELWARASLRPDRFLARGTTDAQGRFDLAYDALAAGSLGRPTLEGRVIERLGTGRRVVHTFEGPREARSLFLDLGVQRLPRLPLPCPAELRAGPPMPADGVVGMPRSHPLCRPAPFHKQVRARVFPVAVAPDAVHAELPPCLEVLPGFEGQALWYVMDYPAAYAPSDPTGAVYPFQELVVATLVRERDRRGPGSIGLFLLAIYVNSDVALVVGRELYGFPKKLAQIEVGESSVRVRRAGLAPGEPPGRVHPIDLVRGQWAPETKRVSPADGLRGFLLDRVSLVTSRTALAAVRSVFDLPFYTHQVLLTPRTPTGPASAVSRVWRSPLDNVRIEGAARLGAARFDLGASTVDPLYRFAPGHEPVVSAASGVRIDVSFSMDAAEPVGGDRAVLEVAHG